MIGHSLAWVALFFLIGASATLARAENILLMCHFDSEDNVTYEKTSPSRHPIRVDINEQRVISEHYLHATLPDGSIDKEGFVIKISAFEIYFGEPFHTIGGQAFEDDVRINRETSEVTCTLGISSGGKFHVHIYRGKCEKYESKNKL
jgi:hypothetical protein